MSLHVQNLHKEFRQGERVVEVLRGIDLEVTKGKIIAIVGPSGSGKSTLLSLLAGLDRPTSGIIKIQSQDLGELDEVQMTRFRGQNIGIVFQQFYLMDHLTSKENVALPLEIAKDPDALEKSTAVLQRVGLGHRLEHQPNQMSGGEVQRVALARALVCKPSLLLADEPTGNLDTETGKKVLDLFFQVIRENQTTTIVVTHSPDLAKRCDEAWLIQDGKMVRQFP